VSDRRPHSLLIRLLKKRKGLLKISFDPLSYLLRGFDRQPFLLNRSLRPVKAEERFSLEPR